MKILERREEKTSTIVIMQLEPSEYLVTLEAAYWNHREEYPVAGYSSGEAPRPVLEQVYGPTVLCEEALTLCVGTYYNTYIRQEGLTQLAQPELLDVQWPDEGGVTLTFRSYFYPKAKLGEYKNLAIPAEVAEDKFEAAALELAAANMEVNIPTPMLEQKLNVLEAQKKVELFNDPLYCLLTDLYKILDSACRLVGVTRGKLQLRSSVAEIVMQTMSADKGEPTRAEICDAIISMVERYRDLPEGFDKEVEQLVEGKLKLGREMDAAERGNDLFETFLSSQDISHTAWRAEQTRTALMLVRQDLLLDAVAEAENLTANDTEVEQFILDLAAQSHATPDEVRSLVDTATLSWQVCRDKARRLIVDSAHRN